jgi:hypothetical protein
VTGRRRSPTAPSPRPPTRSQAPCLPTAARTPSGWRLSDPERNEGFGVPDDELTEAARGELTEIERHREEFLAREPERRRREEARRVRFRVEHLREVIARPPGQDPEVPGKMGLDDGRGTEFKLENGTVHGDAPVQRGWRAYSPAPAPDAASLRVTIESTVVEVELRSA